MIKNILVVDDSFQKIFKDHGLQVKSPIEYILDPNITDENNVRVYNLSSALGYQELGYYTSLLARARKHKIYPSPRVIQDLKDRRIQKLFSEEIHELIQNKFKRLKGTSFDLSVYWGANLSEQYDSIAWELYRLIQAPVFRVYFKKEEEDWVVSRIQILSLKKLNERHLEFLIHRIKAYFNEEMSFKSTRKKYRYELAILHNPEEKAAPSDKKTLTKFIEAFKEVDIKAELIEHADKANISEFDGLFIRETTNVAHHTYRMARNAEKEGLVVLDDPDSIVQCSNKIFLEQLMERLQVNRPKSIILDEHLYKKKKKEFSFPCVVKRPDSAFSQGVHKANNLDELDVILKEMFKITDLILIQEFLPTDFDWRIGILGGEVIYACKYFMSKGHWQIINNAATEEGTWECVDPKLVDPLVLKTALKASKAIGNGLYGVDLKQKGKQVYLIEVNDNPNIDVGVEDVFLGEELYMIFARYFLKEFNKKRGLHA